MGGPKDPSSASTRTRERVDFHVTATVPPPSPGQARASTWPWSGVLICSCKCPQGGPEPVSLSAQEQLTSKAHSHFWFSGPLSIVAQVPERMAQEVVPKWKAFIRSDLERMEQAYRRGLTGTFK